MLCRRESGNQAKTVWGYNQVQRRVAPSPSLCEVELQTGLDDAVASRHHDYHHISMIIMTILIHDK